MKNRARHAAHTSRDAPKRWVRTVPEGQHPPCLASRSSSPSPRRPSSPSRSPRAAAPSPAVPASTPGATPEPRTSQSRPRSPRRRATVRGPTPTPVITPAPVDPGQRRRHARQGRPRQRDRPRRLRGHRRPERAGHRRLVRQARRRCVGPAVRGQGRERRRSDDPAHVVGHPGRQRARAVRRRGRNGPGPRPAGARRRLDGRSTGSSSSSTTGRSRPTTSGSRSRTASTRPADEPATAGHDRTQTPRRHPPRGVSPVSSAGVLVVRSARCRPSSSATSSRPRTGMPSWVCDAGPRRVHQPHRRHPPRSGRGPARDAPPVGRPRRGVG